MRHDLLDYVLLIAFVALASSALFKSTSIHQPAAPSAIEAQPFDCPVPPGVDPAGTPCRP
ncbi:exported hypothetical protein [Candidatus Sulfopaludibacter sp. SbA3]|nr:exported hypothetical protein [Candidatus Sulfopaludibacter sp. SbA3]